MAMIPLDRAPRIFTTVIIVTEATAINATLMGSAKPGITREIVDAAPTASAAKPDQIETQNAQVTMKATVRPNVSAIAV
jgi:hypothetical protein